MSRKERPAPKRIPLLVVGDAVAATGFARVLHSVLDRIKHKYEIHHLGINFLGDPHDTDWKVYVARLGGDVYGINRLPALIETVKPRLVFFINDVWILVRYMPVLKKYKDVLKTVMYFPVDGEPLDPDIIKQLGGVNRLVAYNQFGRRVMQEAVDAARREETEFEAPAIEVIPHGVDTKLFYPYAAETTPEGVISGRLMAKRKLFPNTEEFLESFVVLNANRNQPRKRIDITMQGFALFAENKPENVKLYLHMGTEDVGWNLVTLAKRYGIEGRLILSNMNKAIPTDSVERLNLIYNACEVGINTSTGEGWGLVSFEHAATGAAQIVPRHTTCEELWQGAAEFLEPVFSLTIERVLTEGRFVSPEGVAQALERLYRDPSHLRAMSEAASRNATQPGYDWDRIAKQWDNLFQEVMNEG
ncbi:MAG TPA: glycosyltransferase [Pyrinomonadaceae bacterium]|jgi:glycosyltransferase involved in cell wall biosynthesis